MLTECNGVGSFLFTNCSSDKNVVAKSNILDVKIIKFDIEHVHTFPNDGQCEQQVAAMHCTVLYINLRNLLCP